MANPKERHILFSGPMVRAILEGRKTQTRRIIKPVQPRADGLWHAGRNPLEDCPYGQPGDRLWVRETWALEDMGHDGHRVVWQADRAAAWRTSIVENALRGTFFLGSDYQPARWRPSIHMPRWASRLTLEVTGVRVERLQDISEEDARAEGLAAITKDGTLVKYGIPDRDGLPGTDDDGWPWADWDADPRKAFKRLWTSVYGPESWDANPWVWVVEFRRASGT